MCCAREAHLTNFLWFSLGEIDYFGGEGNTAENKTRGPGYSQSDWDWDLDLGTGDRDPVILSCGGRGRILTVLGSRKKTHLPAPKHRALDWGMMINQRLNRQKKNVQKNDKNSIFSPSS